MRLSSAPGVRLLAGLGASLGDLIWPGTCAACGCDTPAGREPVCEACVHDLRTAGASPACGACGKPAGGSKCAWCDGLGLGPIKRVVRLSPFAEPVRGLIHAAKFRGRWELATWLGRRLGALEASHALCASDDSVLVPVPLHGHRRALRGYDQARLIAAGAAAGLGVKVELALIRRRATAPQTSLTSVAARRTNVRDAFTVADGVDLAGRHVVLVDDVTTTGATLRAAARAVQESGASNISAMVVAVADPRDSVPITDAE